MDTTAGVVSSLLNIGFGGVLLYLIFFKFQPEARDEREKQSHAFLSALEKQEALWSTALEKQEALFERRYSTLSDMISKRDEEITRERKEALKDNLKTRTLTRAAVIVLSGKCPDNTTLCPFKSQELSEGEA